MVAQILANSITIPAPTKIRTAMCNLLKYLLDLQKYSHKRSFETVPESPSRLTVCIVEVLRMIRMRIRTASYSDSKDLHRAEMWCECVSTIHIEL